MPRRTPFPAVALLLAALLALAGPGPAAQAAAKTPFRVTAHASATSVPMGTEVRFSGKVRPQVGGQKVKLQLFYQGAWETIDLGKLTKRARFTTSWTPSLPGSYELRVRIAAGTDKAGRPHSEGFSETMTLTVT